MLFLVPLALVAAAPPPLLAVHPLVISNDPAGARERLEPLLPQVLEPLGLKLAASVDVRSMLASDPVHSCVGRDLCLVGLARATSARFGMLVVLESSNGPPVLSARVIRSDGHVVRTVDPHPFPAAASTDATVQVRSALERIVAELDLPSLVTASPSASTSASVADSTPALRVAAYLCGAAAVGLGATSLTLALSAQGDANQLALLVDSSRRLPADNSEAVRLSSAIDAKSSASIAVAVGAGVALAAGAALFVVSSGDSGPTIAVAPSPTGASVVFSMPLP